MSDLVKRLRLQVEFMVKNWGGDLDDPDQDGLRLWRDAADENERLEGILEARGDIIQQQADEIERLQGELREANGKLMASDMLLAEQRDMLAMIDTEGAALDSTLWLAMKNQRDDAVKEAERLEAIVEEVKRVDPFGGYCHGYAVGQVCRGPRKPFAPEIETEDE